MKRNARNAYNALLKGDTVMSNSPYKIQRFVEIYSEYPEDILREKSVYQWQDTGEEFDTFTDAAGRARILELHLKPVNGFRGSYRIAGADGDVWCAS